MESEVRGGEGSLNYYASVTEYADVEHFFG